MQLRSNCSYPPDISLLLRAYAEQRWLTVEVLPVLCELERPGETPDDYGPEAFQHSPVKRLNPCEVDVRFFQFRSVRR